MKTYRVVFDAIHWVQASIIIDDAEDAEIAQHIAELLVARDPDILRRKPVVDWIENFDDPVELDDISFGYVEQID